MIVHADGDPWDGCVVHVSAFLTSHVVRCWLPKKQRRFAKSNFGRHRTLSTSDLF